MAKRKINRKQLKQPDEFITISSKVLQWGQRYNRQIGYAVIAFLGVILAIVGYRYVDNRTELKGFTRLSHANADYAAKMQTDATSKMAYEAVKADYQDILDDYSGKDAGKIATKTLADISFNAGQYGRAIELYERSLKDFEREPFYRSIILGDLALAYEANNNDDSAIQYFEKVVNMPDAAFSDQALFHLAGLYEEKGKLEEARKLYEKIIAEHAGSIHTDIAKEKIIR